MTFVTTGIASQKAATLAFFLLIPTFMCYQAMAQLQIFPPLLGSYFTAGTLLALPIAAYAATTSLSGSELYKLLAFKLYICFLLLYGVTLTSGALLQVNGEITSYHLLSIVRFVTLFLLVISFDADRPWVTQFVVVFLILYSCFIAVTSDNGSFVLPAFEVRGRYFELDYQTLAFAYMLLLIYALPSLHHLRRFLIYSFSIPALYLIGARSEFFAFFLLIFIVETIHLKTIIYWPLALFAISTATIFLVATNLNDFLDYRVFSIFASDADLSKVARREFSLNAIRTIQENPILGGYATHEPGEYAHNILSAWVDLGIPGFALLTTLLGLSFTSLLVRFRSRCRCVHYTRALAATSITIFLLIAAKTYTYSMVPVSVALYCVWRMRRRGGHCPPSGL